MAIDRDALLEVMACEAYDTAKPTDGQRDMASLILAAAAKHILAPLRQFAEGQAIAGRALGNFTKERIGLDLTLILTQIEADLIGDPHA